MLENNILYFNLKIKKKIIRANFNIYKERYSFSKSLLGTIKQKNI